MGIAAICLLGCSGNNGEEPEKGVIREVTDQVADELVHKMRDPLDKARLVKSQEELRLSDDRAASRESSSAD